MDYINLFIYLCAAIASCWALVLLHRKGGVAPVLLVLTTVVAWGSQRLWKTCGCDGNILAFMDAIRNGNEMLHVCARVCGVAGLPIDMQLL